MPKYFYQAKTPHGKVIHGNLEANTLQDVRLRLQSQGLTPLKVLSASQVQGFVSSQNKSASSRSLLQPRVSLRQLQIFTQQFSTLIYAGLPILDALQILIGHTPKNRPLYSVLSQVKMKIEGGQPLSQAMQSFPKVFDAFYVSMITAGEKGGLLDKVLGRLADALEKKKKLRKDILSASFYPLIIMIFSMLVMIGVFIFVVPQFAQIYQKSNQQLPGITLVVIHASNIIRSYWHGILLGIIGLPLTLLYSYKNPQARKFWDTLFVHTPLLKILVQKSSIAYFTQTLSSLLSAGVHMLEAIEIASDTAKNVFYKNILKKSSVAVKQGMNFSAYLKTQSDYIPSMLTQMIVVGEQSGNIDLMLEKVALFYEEEVDRALKNFMSLIEPLLIVVFGLVIAFVVLSIYLPILNISQTIGG